MIDILALAINDHNLLLQLSLNAICIFLYDYFYFKKGMNSHKDEVLELKEDVRHSIVKINEKFSEHATNKDIQHLEEVMNREFGHVHESIKTLSSKLDKAFSNGA